ncbi:hypothetical protein RAS12_21230 [Achromobacter seleniivolatilans]|uniref:Uncharacterized protein n=1 Tax=Achromobacter seleniivolatilans TaxID=3047478 RepID=A0ABY9LWG8_9BURK|nr:hypothetical protein [Achromobacter sp. R39]WMD19131.1 hypothetical protein RAS12_21230 [Achromobacter sp. R39]
MALPPEPYLPRRIAPIDTWRVAGHAIKVYGIHRDPNLAGPIFSDTVATSVRAAVQDVLDEHAGDERSHGLGFCIVHVGEEAVWLLVDWWMSGGIVCQRMLSAPLAQPDSFSLVNTPALACVWELVITAHERNAWVRHMLTAHPDANAYLADVLPPGQY